MRAFRNHLNKILFVEDWRSMRVGYAVMPSFVEESDLRVLFPQDGRSVAAWAKKKSVIFNQSTKTAKLERFQMKVEDKECVRIVEETKNRALRALGLDVDEYQKAKQPFYVGTFPGTKQDQRKHCDLQPETNPSSYAMMIYGYDDTQLVACPSCRGKRTLRDNSVVAEGSLENCVTLQLKRGDVVVFESKFIHAGAKHPRSDLKKRHEETMSEAAALNMYSAEELRMRVHAYVCHKDDVCETDYTHVVAKTTV